MCHFSIKRPSGQFFATASKLGLIAPQHIEVQIIQNKRLRMFLNHHWPHPTENLLRKGEGPIFWKVRFSKTHWTWDLTMPKFFEKLCIKWTEPNWTVDYLTRQWRSDAWNTLSHIFAYLRLIDLFLLSFPTCIIHERINMNFYFRTTRNIKALLLFPIYILSH